MIIFSLVDSYAQIVSTQWLLPNNNIVNFEEEISVINTVDFEVNRREGVSVVMDSDGEVLFIATDVAIYNKDWEIISNGSNLEGSMVGSSAQSPAVLQNPANDSQYYIFYIQDHEDDNLEGDFKYSIVEVCDEMEEISVLVDFKNIQIAGDYSERMTIVEIDRKNYWLLTTELFEKKLYAFKVSEEGIDLNPVVNNISSIFDGQIGQIEINNAKDKLAWASTFTATSGLSIFDFDLNTGLISNEKKISNREVYGIEWSHSDDYIFFSDIHTGSGVYSYSLVDETTITLAERGGNSQYGDLKYNPVKEEIIVSQVYNNKLGKISNIENGGEYAELDISFSGNVDMRIGLQQQVINYGIDEENIPEILEKEIFCLTDGEVLILTVSDEFEKITWSDGQEGNSASFSNEGVYQVEAYYNCHLVSVEFVIKKEAIFEQECNQEFDGSFLNEMLLLHYDLDNNTTDLSGNGFNGTAINTIDIENREGETSSAMSFNGNSQIEIPSKESLQITYPFAISVWGSFETDISFDNAILSSNFVNNNYHGIILSRGVTGNANISVGNGIGNTGPNNRKSIASEPGLIPLNTWTHIVFNVIGPGEAEIYIDGCSVPVNYSGDGSWEITYTDAPFIIGRSDSNTLPGFLDNLLKGSLDDFYFWNRTITEEEVLYLYDRFEIPEIEIDDVYTILDGENGVILELPADYSNIIWSDGQEGNLAAFTQEGIYNVEAMINCHLVCKQFNVIKEAIFIVDCSNLPIADNLDQNLIVHFELDGNGDDSAQGMSDGSLTGTTGVEDRFGNANSAMKFGINEEINIPNEQRFEISFPFSFSFWANFESTGSTREGGIFSSSYTQNNYMGIIVNRIDDGRISCQVGNGTGSISQASTKSILTENAVPQDTWMHIAIVVDGPNIGHIFIDGCEVPTTLGGSGVWNIVYANGPMKIGRTDTSPNSPQEDNYLVGTIDDFYFWNRSISQEEILFLHDRFEVPSLIFDDQNIECDEFIVFEVPSEFTNVEWSDGQVGNTGLFDTSGDYTVEATFECHPICTEFSINFNSLDVVDLPDSIVSCEERIILEAPFDVFWEDGSFSTEFEINETGVYTLYNICGVELDEVFVEIVPINNFVEEQYLICEEDQNIISLPTTYENVLWSDGSSDNSFEMEEEGTFSVEYTLNDCQFEEVFVVDIQRCVSCEFFIPNIINPNSSTGNERFQVSAKNVDCFVDSRISIFDRWGNLIFDDTGNAPWDGWFNGVQVEEGVYVYFFTATIDNERISQYGSITVLY